MYLKKFKEWQNQPKLMFINKFPRRVASSSVGKLLAGTFHWRLTPDKMFGAIIQIDCIKNVARYV